MQTFLQTSFFSQEQRFFSQLRMNISSANYSPSRRRAFFLDVVAPTPSSPEVVSSIASILYISPLPLLSFLAGVWVVSQTLRSRGVGRQRDGNFHLTLEQSPGTLSDSCWIGKIRAEAFVCRIDRKIFTRCDCRRLKGKIRKSA